MMRPVVVGLGLLGLFLAACVGDPPREQAADPVTAPAAPPADPAAAPALPPQLRNLDAGEVTVIDGDLSKAGDPQALEKARAKVAAEVAAKSEGWIGVDVCGLLSGELFEGWPGGSIGEPRKQRSNVAQIVLGCIASYPARGGKRGGQISLYVSDNQSPALAEQSVLGFVEGGAAELVADFGPPAAYDATTGEFVWAHGKGFVTLVIDHPAVAGPDRAAWSRRVAGGIEAKLP